MPAVFCSESDPPSVLAKLLESALCIGRLAQDEINATQMQAVIFEEPFRVRDEHVPIRKRKPPRVHSLEKQVDVIARKKPAQSLEFREPGQPLGGSHTSEPVGFETGVL
jgi:hypothetical protein